MTRIIYQFKRIPTESRALERLAEELGVSMFNTVVTKFDKTIIDTYEVQRRIRENIKDWRDGSLWLLALLSAAASFMRHSRLDSSFYCIIPIGATRKASH
jgi:hypothetical protein